MIGAHAAALLDVFEVRGIAEALIHRPPRAAGEHAIELTRRELDLALCAHTRRDVTEQSVGELGQARRDGVKRHIGAQAADAARDVETHAAGGDDAALLGIERQPVFARTGEQLVEPGNQCEFEVVFLELDGDLLPRFDF